MPGVSGSVDMNWIFKDYTSTKPATTKPVTKPSSVKKTDYSVKVTAQAGLNVRKGQVQTWEHSSAFIYREIIRRF